MAVANAVIDLQKGGRWVLTSMTSSDGCIQVRSPGQSPDTLRVYAPGFQTVTHDVSQAGAELGFGRIVMKAAALPWVPQRVVAPDRYPPLASAALIEGTVVIRCAISDDGRVVGTEAVAGHPLLGLAALENAKSWRFRRSAARGEADEVELIYTFELVGKAARERRLQFSFEYPNHVRIASEPPCADHAPCTPEEVREWERQRKKNPRFSIP